MCPHLYIEVTSNLQRMVPRSRTTRYGQRSFAVSGPTLWNSLPLIVHGPSLSLSQFCVRFKALSCRAYQTSSWPLRDSLGCKACCANINILTYLLTYLLAYLLSVAYVCVSLLFGSNFFKALTCKPHFDMQVDLHDE